MANDFTGATQTVKGIAVRNVKFNSIPGKWLGQIYFAASPTENKWIACMWNKNGKASNRLHPEFDLK